MARLATSEARFPKLSLNFSSSNIKEVRDLPILTAKAAKNGGCWPKTARGGFEMVNTLKLSKEAFSNCLSFSSIGQKSRRYEFFKNYRKQI